MHRAPRLCSEQQRRGVFVGPPVARNALRAPARHWLGSVISWSAWSRILPASQNNEQSSGGLSPLVVRPLYGVGRGLLRRGDRRRLRTVVSMLSHCSFWRAFACDMRCSTTVLGALSALKANGRSSRRIAQAFVRRRIMDFTKYRVSIAQKYIYRIPGTR